MTRQEELFNKVINKRLERKRAELDKIESNSDQNTSERIRKRSKMQLTVEIKELESIIDIHDTIKEFESGKFL